MEYGLIDIKTQEIIERKTHEQQPPDVSHKGIMWLPLSITRPSFDSNIQKELPPSITISDTSIEIVYQVVDLTEQERQKKIFDKINYCLFGADEKVGIGLLYVINQLRQSQDLEPFTKQQLIDEIGSISA